MTTPEQFREEMQKIQDEEGWDCKRAHHLMDEVLCRVLAELGYHEGVEVFASQWKWYS